MARPREFDESQVLESAMEAFWERGYEATSLCDLVHATGLSRGSLYKAYRSKRGLYLEVLRRYLAWGAEQLDRAFSGDSMRDGLRAFLVAMSLGDGSPASKGCFAINSVVELGPHDGEVRALLKAHARAQQERLARAVQRGIELGEFSSRLNARESARTIYLLTAGLQVGRKTWIDPGEVEATVELVLRMLE